MSWAWRRRNIVVILVNGKSRSGTAKFACVAGTFGVTATFDSAVGCVQCVAAIAFSSVFGAEEVVVGAVLST